MIEFQAITNYILCFIALYAQVFLLLVAFQERKQIIRGTVVPNDVDWPAVTIIVPCWNEETTVARTLRSLTKIDYPEGRLFIKVVDDGSTDTTWQAMQEFQGFSNIELIHKENGGKHTAMNMAIKATTTEFIGCLDADAFVNSDTLRKTMWQFFADPSLMAVSPAIIVYKPKGFLQKAVEVEYSMFILIKKVLGILNGIHVTQGPFSVYRKSVFDNLGPYRNAHNTEDLEIAYRMQVAGYKIGQCHDAFVYTVTPNTFKGLYRQRLRWVYGFLNNSYDYRKYLMKPKFGTFSIFTVPIGIVSILSSLIFTSFLIWNAYISLNHLVVRLVITNFYLGHIAMPSFNFFYLNLQPLNIITYLFLSIYFGLALIGQKLSDKNPIPNISFIYFILIFTFMTPIWFTRAIYNSLVTREMTWR